MWQPCLFTTKILWIISHLRFQGSGGLNWKENREQLLSIRTLICYVHSLLEMSSGKAAISTWLKTHGSCTLRTGIHYWKNNKGKFFSPFLFPSLSLCCCRESCVLEKTQGLEGIRIMSGNKGEEWRWKGTLPEAFSHKAWWFWATQNGSLHLRCVTEVRPWLSPTHNPFSALLVPGSC